MLGGFYETFLHHKADGTFLFILGFLSANNPQENQIKSYRATLEQYKVKAEIQKRKINGLESEVQESSEESH
jgi:hypothetical protein